MTRSCQTSANPRRRYNHFSNRINTVVSKYQFPNEGVKEIIKIMVLQHAVKFHAARDWICLQDQTTLLAHCKQLEARCVQYQQAQAQGRVHLISITAASSSSPSIQANIQSNSQQPCSRFGYSTPAEASCLQLQMF